MCLCATELWCDNTPLQAYLSCLSARAALFLWFIAIAFPFYGLINSIIGALTGSMVSFILPALAYNLYYLRSAAARVNAPKQPPR